eukprot:UN5070
MRSHGILQSWRFRDDSVALCCDVDGAERWFEMYRRKCGYYKAVLEGVSYTEMVFLDCKVYKSIGNYCTRPHFKPSMMNNHPLSADSGHHPNVHLSWARAQLKRISRLASNRDIAERAKSEYIQRFVDHYTHDVVIDGMRQVSVARPLAQNACPTTVRTRSENVWWMGLSYHPAVRRQIGWALAKLNSEAGVRTLLQSAAGEWADVIVKVAWRNSAKYMWQRIRYCSEGGRSGQVEALLACYVQARVFVYLYA